MNSLILASFGLRKIPDRVIWRWIMMPVAEVYRFAVMCRAWAYRRGIFATHNLGVRVISVGNIETGGTGKTPFVAGLCAELIKAGRRPLVLSRGHGSGLPRDFCAAILGGRVLDCRSFAGSHVAASRSLVASLHPDEAMMLSNMLPSVPVLIGGNRVRAWEVFSKVGFPGGVGPTDVILDDGFQHLAIARDADVVLLSPGVGVKPRDSICLPAGNLREPLPALRRANFLVGVIGREKNTPDRASPLAQEVAHIRYGELFQPMHREGNGGAATSAGFKPPARPLIACGIARPEAFVEAIRARGITPANLLFVGDHENFTPEGVRRALARDLDGEAIACDAIITTAKDFWRKPEILLEPGVPVWILPMLIDFPYGKLLINL